MLGWLGGTFIAIHMIPQALKCVREGHAEGLSSAMLVAWFVGEVFLVAHNYQNLGNDLPLLFNYTVNLLCLFVITLYKARPRPQAPVLSLAKFRKLKK